MIGNLFVKVLTVAAPVLGSVIALDQIASPATTSMPAGMAVVEARADFDLGNGVDAGSVPTVPVTVTSQNSVGKSEHFHMNFEIKPEIIQEIKQDFKSDATVILRSVEEALLDATQAESPQVREASQTVLPLVQKEVPYQVKPGIKLPVKIEKKVAELAKATYQKTGKRLVVTSGARTAYSQADAMKTKLDLGESPRRLYANKKAAGEIENAYRWAVKTGLSGTQVVDTMAMVIQRQIDSGVYISRHLRQGAVDLRSRDLSGSEKATVKYVAKAMGAKVLLESTPPHFHIEIL